MNKLSLLALSALLAAGPVASGMAADQDGRDSWSPEDRPIVGAWQVEFTVRVNAPDCSTAMPVPVGPNPFPALHTYHEGGTLSETGSRSPPSMRSPGHGVWERTGRRKYAARYTFQTFDVDGIHVMNMDIRSALTLSKDGESFTGTARLAFSDLDGNTLPFCATLEGIRFSL